jgi:hypothetical protein
MSSRIRILTLTCALAVTAGCASAGARRPAESGIATRDTAWVVDAMYFGASMPGGGVVTDSAWDAFVREVVTPRFPDGLTFWSAHGQWREPDGRILREESRVLQVAHPSAAAADSSLDRIVAEYRARFHQQSVLRVRTRAEVRF